ncbi:MAG: WcbI family polysaccharide biosynthesis putative acetyltransferase [Humibacillus sp.]
MTAHSPDPTTPATTPGAAPADAQAQGSPSTDAAAVRTDPARARHYGQFYGLLPLPEGGRPLLVVHGNCQAESLRQLLQEAPDSPWSSVRVPPVHELAADEVALVQRLLQRADVVLTQPIGEDYHGLPLGTAQVRATASRARTLVWPVIRYAGLHPWQIVHNHPDAGDPPVVPYHDARTLVLASQGRRLGPGSHADPQVSAWSIAELRRREEAAGAVPVSDLVLAAGSGATRTINHPANPVLIGLARRVQEALGLAATAVDPGRRLLDAIHAPIEPQVLDALGLDQGEARHDWLVGGEVVTDETVVETQLEWLRARPRVLADIVERHHEQIAMHLAADEAST